MAKSNKNKNWFTPSKRAASYSEDRKGKVYSWGEKEGQQLSNTQLSYRSGYLRCQSDHAGEFKYHQALDAGFTKEEAAQLSRKPWGEIKGTIQAKKNSKKGGKK